MACSSISIDWLPNEILIQILEIFPTSSLLPLAAVSHRFHDLVSRIHYARLVEAAALRERSYELILECYHPMNKLSTPYMFCDYLGTAGLEEAGQFPSLGKLNGLYSRFRPVLGEENRRPRARYPTRGVVDGRERPLASLATHEVDLDAGESFSQLCAVTNLVKVGPRRGLFLSCVNMSDHVIRIWRDWLSNAAMRTSTVADEQQRESVDLDDSSILWTDSSKNVGLRFRVVEKADIRGPVLVGPGDDMPVAYTMEYEELLIRTNSLLLNLEKAEAQQVTHAAVTLQELFLSSRKVPTTHQSTPSSRLAGTVRHGLRLDAILSDWYSEHGRVTAYVKFAGWLVWAITEDVLRSATQQAIEVVGMLADGLVIPFVIGLEYTDQRFKILDW